ncbi:MAG: S8 family serine peptidase, partial [Chthoniobacterales bacterium]
MDLQNKAYRAEKRASTGYIQALDNPNSEEKKSHSLQKAHEVKEAWSQVVEALNKGSAQAPEEFKKWWAGQFKKAEEKQVFWNDVIRLHDSKENLPSNNDQREFPYARIVDVAEKKNVPEVGKETHIRILKTICHYPYVRIEEETDAATGRILKHREMVADHLIVTLAEGEDPEVFKKKLEDELNALNLNLTISMERSAPSLTDYRLSFRPAPDSLNAKKEPTIEAFDAILEATKYLTVSREPNFLSYFCAIPNDPGYAEQWHLIHEIAGIRAAEGWDRVQSARTIIVAIIDTGMHLNHEDLLDNMWIRAFKQEDLDKYKEHKWNLNGQYYGYNAFDKDFTPVDSDGHGTLIGGTVGAKGNNYKGTTGVAWEVQLMACKAGNKDILDDERARCIKFACDHGAKILNCSYKAVNYFKKEFEALKDARNKGVIAVVAAGNREAKSRNIPDTDGYDSSKDPSHYFNNDFYPTYPSNYGLDNVVTVAASDKNNQLSIISHYGAESVHIAAPGEDILSTGIGPDLLTENESNNAYFVDTGTSMAVPQVSGALALMMTKFPDLIYYKLINRLFKTTDELTPNPDAGNQSIRFGRLNLARALSPDREYDANDTHAFNKITDAKKLIQEATLLENDQANGEQWRAVKEKAQQAEEYFTNAINAFREEKEEEGDSWDNAFESIFFAAQQLSKKIKLLNDHQNDEADNAQKASQAAQAASEYFVRAVEAFAKARNDFDQDGNEDKKREKEEKEAQPWDRAGMFAQSAARHFAQIFDPTPEGLDRSIAKEKKKSLLTLGNYEMKASEQVSKAIGATDDEIAKKYRLASEYFTNAIQTYMAGKNQAATSWEEAGSKLAKTTKYTASRYLKAAQQSKRASDCFAQAAKAFEQDREKVGESLRNAANSAWNASEQLALVEGGDVSEVLVKQAEKHETACSYSIKAVRAYMAGKNEQAECWDSAARGLAQEVKAIAQDKTEARDSWHQAAESALKAAEQLASSESSE